MEKSIDGGFKTCVTLSLSIFLSMLAPRVFLCLDRPTHVDKKTQPPSSKLLRVLTDCVLAKNMDYQRPASLYKTSQQCALACPLLLSPTPKTLLAPPLQPSLTSRYSRPTRSVASH